MTSRAIRTVAMLYFLSDQWVVIFEARKSGFLLFQAIVPVEDYDHGQAVIAAYNKEPAR